jgi:predicted ATP-binding protein involved in virulence
MLTEYQLTNFKAFSKTKPIPIRPITLIYGPNSSGKSSIIQSLLLLKQTLQHAESPDIILIPKGNLVDLGSYRDFVYCHDVSQPFSIQATLPFHPQKWLEKSWALEQLQDTTELKIRINFAYDAEQSRIVFDSVLLFINHQTIPLILINA